MTNSPSPVMATPSRAIRFFPEQKIIDLSSLRPQRDFQELINRMDTIPTPVHTGIRTNSDKYHCAWTTAPSPIEKHATILYLSRALPPKWNPRSAYAGEGFNADSAQEAITLELRVTTNSIEPIYLYPSTVQLKDYASENDSLRVQRSQRDKQKNIEQLRINDSTVQETQLDDSAEAAFTLSNEPRKYFASREANEKLERLLNCSAKSALSHFSKYANIITADLLTRLNVALPIQNSNMSAPWYRNARGEEHMSMLALQQIASVVSTTPRLSANTLQRYVEAGK